MDADRATRIRQLAEGDWVRLSFEQERPHIGPVVVSTPWETWVTRTEYVTDEPRATADGGQRAGPHRVYLQKPTGCQPRDALFFDVEHNKNAGPTATLRYKEVFETDGERFFLMHGIPPYRLEIDPD